MIASRAGKLLGEMKRLFEPVDAHPLALFRIVFGLCLCLESWGAVATGWVREVYLEPQLHFPFIEGLAPLPGQGMTILYLVVGAASLMLALGLFFRVVTPIAAVGITYGFLLEKTAYINHHYLCAMLAWMLLVIPAHRVFSLDARRARAAGTPLPVTAPAWTLWLLRFQIGVVYFFGGIAKCNPDWIAGQPPGMWMAVRADWPIVGSIFATAAAPWVMVWGGLVFDLLVVPALLWRRTRVAALVAACVFHAFNQVIFQVGIFSFISIAMTLLFFPPETIARVIFRRRTEEPSSEPTPAEPAPAPVAGTEGPGRGRRLAITAALAAWGILHVFLPLRHHLIDGRVDWTEEGHRFAWRMMLRQKVGKARFFVTDPATHQVWGVDPADLLTKRQLDVGITQPDVIVQLARHIEARFAAEHGIDDPEVRARVRVSLNGREPQLIVDQWVDLTEVEHPWLGHGEWIKPVTRPLRKNPPLVLGQ